MSYGQQNRTTESWNDPNNFTNVGGPDAGFHNERVHRDGSAQQFNSQRPTGDPTDTSNWDASHGANPQSGEGAFWTPGPGDNYGTSATRGNTTDVNTFGAGGDFGNTGRAAGVNPKVWESRDPAVGMDQNTNSNVQPGAGKTSMGERLMGNAEKLAGRVTGNPSMVERGQVRKSGNPDDTTWNSNGGY
ncbi:hypothetical protein C8Q78DRAFT_315964 [Trametes maxima]|nr:hypothetical protein C8Q78DRAFT_315964 [Trametes maxima]